MPYIIETWDKLDHQSLRLSLRPLHLEYLQQQRHLLMVCGAKLDENDRDLGGGIYVVDVQSYEEANNIIQQDPFFKGELFQKVQITKLRKAYFNFESFLKN